MPTTLTNGIQLPDKGSVDWYSSMQSNYNLIDTHLGDTDVHVTAEDKANWNSKQGSLSQAQLDAIAQVATNTSDIATLQTGKANASHTHSSSDITDIGDYATKQYVDNSISGLVDNAPAALDTLNELSAALNDDANFASTVTNALSAKANSADLATVATSGSYNDLSNKPTVNDAILTIQKNGVDVQTFTANASSNVTCNITVPTKTSELTNDSRFLTSHQSLDSCLKNSVTNSQTIKSTAITRGTAPSSAQTFGIPFTDNNNKYIGNVYGVFGADKSTYVGLYAYKGTTTSNSDNVSVRVGYDASGNAYTYAPTPATTDNSTQIATTAFVKAQGYLGMPDFSNGIDISGYINTGDSDNSYTPLADGYISVRANSTNSCALYASQGDVYISSYGNIVDVDLGGYICSLFIPVVKNVACRIVCRRAQTIVSAKFFPCLGNV